MLFFKTVFHELSEEIRKLPLLSAENQQLIENNTSFDYYQQNSFRGINSNNDFDGAINNNNNNLGGTGSNSTSNSHGGGGNSGEDLGNINGMMTNQLQSAPESPIRGQSPTRMGRDNSPFIPRSSTNRLMTSSSPFRRSNQQESINYNNISIEQLSEIIKETVATALETAQLQWIKELKNGTFTHPDFAGSENFQHRFVQLSSKVDILQDQVQNIIYFLELFYFIRK